MAKQELERDVAYERQIHGYRADLLKAYIGLIGEKDVETEWDIIVKNAHEAGLSKEILTDELSCSWSTITRWMSGSHAPGIFTRRKVREKLVELLNNLRLAEIEHAKELV